MGNLLICLTALLLLVQFSPTATATPDKSVSVAEAALEESQSAGSRLQRSALFCQCLCAPYFGPIGSFQNPAQSCKHLKAARYAASGEYWIQPRGCGKMQVYCDMDTAGGGFTFVSTGAVTSSATSSCISQLMTDKSTVLFRFLTDGSNQFYSAVQQLDKFRYKPLFVAQNSYVGYTQPINKNTMGRSGYLFVGIIDSATARVKGAVQGYKSNGIPLTFVNCDGNPNSNIVLFPNHFRSAPSSYYGGNGMYVQWQRTFATVKPGLKMPWKYFFFTEMHFGGCGAFVSSDRWGSVRASAIGVR